MADYSAAIILRDEFSDILKRLDSGSARSAQLLEELGDGGAEGIEETGEGFDLLGKGALVASAGLAAAYGVIQAGKVAYDLAEDAAAIEAVETAFANLTASAGVNANAFLAEMRAATRGTMADVEIMQIANRSILAMGGDLAQQLPTLFEAARVSSLATGEDIGYVFDTLAKGIVRASPLLIDNANIFLKVGDAVDDYAASIGKSADELTVKERQVAILNAVLEQSAEFTARAGLEATTSAEGYAKMELAVGALKTTIGKLINESGFPEWMGGLADKVNEVAVGLPRVFGQDELFNAWNAKQDAVRAWGAAWDDVLAAQKDLEKAETSWQYALTRQASVDHFTAKLQEAETALAAADEQLNTAKARYEELSGAQEQVAATSAAAVTAAEQVTTANASLAESSTAATDAIHAESEALAGYRQILEEVNALQTTAPPEDDGVAADGETRRAALAADLAQLKADLDAADVSVTDAILDTSDPAEATARLVSYFTAADPGQALADSLDGAGDKLLTALHKTLKDSEDGFTAAGLNLGATLAGAVVKGVENGVQGLVDVIARAVAPEVAAILRTDQGAGALP